MAIPADVEIAFWKRVGWAGRTDLKIISRAIDEQ